MESLICRVLSQGHGQCSGIRDRQGNRIGSRLSSSGAPQWPGRGRFEYRRGKGSKAGSTDPSITTLRSAGPFGRLSNGGNVRPVLAAGRRSPGKPQDGRPGGLRPACSRQAGQVRPYNIWTLATGPLSDLSFGRANYDGLRRAFLWAKTARVARLSACAFSSRVMCTKVTSLTCLINSIIC